AQRISMVPGVAQVSVRGSQKFAVRAQLDPRALAARQVGIDEVVSAMQSGNSNLPTGTLWGRHEAVTVESNGQLTNAEQFGSVVIAYRNGAPVRLRDLGRVLDSVEDERNINWSQTGRSMTLAIDRQPGSNTVAVIENIKKILPEVEERLPPAVNMNIRYDRSDSILDSVNDVKFTLLLALVLVILVIFLFLRNASATAIPSTALPLSLVGTFAVMYLLHYSLDNLSLMALTLAVGFVVDDAIVMLENIVRHMEQGEAPMEAALRGSSEIGFTILSMTISLAAVFVPVLFLGGIVGRLLHEFAVTITTAILVSGFVSLSLTPMLCSRFLSSPHDQKHGAFYSFFESLFDGLLNIYSWSLRLVMRHRLVTMALSLILLVATGWMFVQVPKGFLPSEETGLINGFTETVQGTSFDSMMEHQRRLDKILKNNPYIEDYLSGTGGDRGGSNAGMLFLKLVPRSKRPSADSIIEELRPQFNKLTGIRVFLTNPPAIRIGSRASKSEYQFTLQSPDLKSLYASAPKLEARLRQMPGLQDISTDLQIKNPQVRVDIDRDKASTLGVTAEQIEDSLYSAFGARQVSTIFASTNSYSVMVELLPEFQRDPNALSMLYIRSNTGKLVPLSEVSHISRTVGPLSVNHSGQMPSVTVSFNLTPGYPLGNAVNDVNKAARQTLPSTISTGFQGSAQAFDSSLSGLG
ncbi:MAG TPA: efflux RND transporter permease subunit, partial [Terriglobales bacterium]|nr:efflux RND transporter permease subunit [Terriglobales bacterium]